MITAQSKQEAFNIAAGMVMDGDRERLNTIQHEDQTFVSQLHHAYDFAAKLFGTSAPATRQWKMNMLRIAKHYELDDSIIKASL